MYVYLMRTGIYFPYYRTDNDGREDMYMIQKGEITVDKKPDMLDRGYEVEFVTMYHNSPLHLHQSMELQFILNGHAVIGIDGHKYTLKPLDFVVIDALTAHDVIYGMPQTMGICLHISKNHMREYVPDIELRRISYFGETGTREQQEACRRIKENMRQLTVSYMRRKDSYRLRCGSLILGTLAELVDHFSSPAGNAMTAGKLSNISRLEQICAYVEEHYREPLELQGAADLAGLNKDYFCRFFAKNMGESFITYVNQVRIHHIYQDLLRTDDGIREIMERHGFVNQKLFYQRFREIYGCTPRQLRDKR